MLTKSFGKSLALAGLHLLLNSSALASSESSITVTAQFESELQAVQHASNLYNPASVREDREFMGVIFRRAAHAGFLFGYTVGAGQSGQDTVTVRARIPQGSEIVAFWHTHGAEHWTRQYFSPEDTELAREWGLPFYMAAADGHLRVYRPEQRPLSKRQAMRLGLGPMQGSSQGELVGTVNV
ncbi:DUF4329 domain-containing protein [Pseudohongiella spirulinae]|uniref:DUF4329 domain-containing protein n=1 Tax=Pseudohongiella spirulinae TaxID=1249552 RepID=A0A0S2KC95_9GAMM|nr:DUF4329 domain-containing protein [Pseudohongiella spirulinae]ALO45959.1 hypothetical protein PS2015_1301 [Pseudohongiella spirulinae]